MTRSDMAREASDQPTCQETNKCRNLWAMVLERAIRDAQQYSDREARRSAIAWFNDKRTATGSWFFIQQVLCYDPSSAREIESKVRRSKLSIVK